MKKATQIYAAVCAVLLFSGYSQLWALEIKGRVQTVSGKTVLVVTDGDVVPATGDRAEIFSRAGGSVASGKVIGRKETTVTKNQLVHFTPRGPAARPLQRPAR